MKYNSFYVAALGLLFFVSCSESKKDTPKPKAENIMTALPFTNIGLVDINGFKKTTGNWKIVGGVYANTNEDKMLSSEEGAGILVNLPNDEQKDNLHTVFEHGDLELELDVMMPKGSNSGLYFQSRYEVQLLDSWGVENPKHGDMGGIYQRWDETNEKGEEGFEGFAPRMNASKAPGLWQHLKIIFHAPRFDASGNKTKNAWFEEVWLNGVLIHQNIQLSGPTRGGAGPEEVPMASLMIQGDHGPVALKNIQYKRYGAKTIGFKNLQLQTYDNTDNLFPNLDSVAVLEETSVENIDLKTIANNNSQKIFKYTGLMGIPDSGDYLFDVNVDGGAALLINTDTLINMNGNYNRDSLGLGKINLSKGDVPFTLIYNKHTPWRRHFDFFVEGPEIQKYSLQKAITQETGATDDPDFTIKVGAAPITQRSFWMHKDEKRTHCISVGMPQRINYTYDLEMGSLLTLWGGEFMDAEKMWRGRGPKQLGEPLGAIVSLHGHPEFALLKTKDAKWPDSIAEDSSFKSLGYEFNTADLPRFLYRLNGSEIVNTLVPSSSQRALRRTITVDGSSSLWHKVAQGESIEKLPNGTFIVNDESYFINFAENFDLATTIRNSNGFDELLVEIPQGKQKIEYDIIW
ncbi:DUF1080 domain-containing protein [Maribacter sp. 2307UL18-2]|uniref:3-keto-disaccharide hydrolase n=1 Tax=Maribacter sp. 2307UL18-2 TaxID=3386274 RepID=UPI0039BD376C